MNKNKKRFKLNRSSVLILTVCVLLFLVMGLITYIKVSELMLDQSKQSGMNLARTIAAEIDGDRMNEVRSESDPGYSVILSIMSKYRYYTYVKYIYTMRLEDKANLSFVVDGDPEDPAKCGEAYTLTDDMLPAFSGEVCSDTQVSTDAWGSYYSAYAPVFCADGSVAGIVGVDIDVNYINSYLNKLMLALATICIFFAVITVGLYMLFSIELTGKDVLTGLYTYETLVKKGNSLKKHGELVGRTAVLVNIKGFKYINRQYGYDYGNELLKSLAKFLREGLIQGEMIARTGNDNFCILVMNERSAAYIARLKQTNPTSIDAAMPDGLPAPVRCGVYTIKEDDTMEQVMGICTVVMNVARNRKKEDIVYYNREIYENILEEGDLLSSYKQAIRNGEFKVFYQPKVDIATNTLCGAEALVRWQKEDRFISPGQFIPLLENEGLITELDFYVFETVCNDIRLWKNQGITPVPISSNFSKLHLSNPDFAEKIVKTADKWQTEHRYLAVEMTESSGYSDMEALTTFVEQMNKTGIRVNMDDFGTGYSSLSLLGDVDMDTIKIDKSFVDRIFGERESGSKLVSSVIRLIHDMDREVICEGVETIEQVNFLKKTDCKLVQGYYFDKPLEHSVFTERLKHPAYER
ncbi:MAG: EAL domain-containing protein [Lachnospiraceae bacterium]|nr:EAL domain-containing protein [Lachnospiraceae bacterium]